MKASCSLLVRGTVIRFGVFAVATVGCLFGCGGDDTEVANFVDSGGNDASVDGAGGADSGGKAGGATRGRVGAGTGTGGTGPGGAGTGGSGTGGGAGSICSEGTGRDAPAWSAYAGGAGVGGAS